MVRRWIKSRKRKPELEYDETKRKFEMAMGKPFIVLKVEIPTGFEDLQSRFLRLESDDQFHEEVKDLIKKRLLLEKHHQENIT
ncbi:MAG: hypothetical protein JSW19_02225 [Candidatus Bathyarchaeota archaeon]|nr:MAG: hypothetical protein JSW19_02225 [Candidatus Bathyarchaeota archaeon]